MNESDLLKIMGARIRKLREERSISQQNLAAICNFEKANMSRIENGRTNPTFLTLHKISVALNVSLSILVDLNDDKSA